VSTVDEPVSANADAAMVAPPLSVADPLVAASEVTWEFAFNPLRSPTMVGRPSLTPSWQGVALAFCNLPIAVASLVSCATLTPIGALSEIVIEAMCDPLSEWSAAAMSAAVSVTASR
jgi:hypothetical protein